MFSREHVKFKPTADAAIADENMRAYFSYSFWELATYDQPAQVNFILKLTGKKKINYVGYSQGTT